MAELTDCDSCGHDLSISGVSLMNGLAWCCTDLSDLLQTGDVRGEDTLIPGAAGVLPNPKRLTVTKLQFPMVFVGSVDRTGALQADEEKGLDANLDYFRINVAAQPGGSPGTRAAVWTKPSGSTKSAQVHVIKFRPQLRIGPSVKAILEISLPAGEFA